MLPTSSQGHLEVIGIEAKFKSFSVNVIMYDQRTFVSHGRRTLFGAGVAVAGTVFSVVADGLEHALFLVNAGPP